MCYVWNNNEYEHLNIALQLARRDEDTKLACVSLLPRYLLTLTKALLMFHVLISKINNYMKIVYISPSAMLPHIKMSLFARKQVCLYRLFCLSWVGYYQNGPLYEASLDKSCFISCFSDTSDWLIFCFWWMFMVRVGFSCGVQSHKPLAYTPKTCPQLGKLITCSVCSLGVNTFIPHLALKYPQHTGAHTSVKV